jgi:hypothetical protein
MGYDSNGSDSTMLIVKVAAMFLIGMLLFVNIGSIDSVSKTSSVTLKFTKNPKSGETIKLGKHNYEFYDDGYTVASGDIPVPIGATLEITVDNFRHIAEENYDVE